MDGPSKGKLQVRYDLLDLPLDISPDSVLEGRRLTGLDITEGLRELAINNNPAPRIISPATPTFASTRRLMRSRQRSSDAVCIPRSKLRRKAATAPPSTLYLLSSIPQPSRRAISARVSRQDQNRSKGGRQSGLWNASLPRVSVYGIPASRSLISRRKSNRKSVGRLGLKPRNSVWRVPPHITVKKYHLISEAFANRKNSFSEKTRVKETLKNKVEFPKMNIRDIDALDLPDTPGSIASTPKEMYGTPAEDALLGYHPLHLEPGKRRLLPTDRVNHSHRPLLPDIQRCDFVARSNSKLNVGTAKAQCTASSQQVYVPGPIRLEEKLSATPRKGSIATLEPFDGEAKGGRKKHSDLVALDGIVAYFHSLGVLDETGEDGLDRYWEPEWRTNPTVPRPRRPIAAPPVPTRPPPPAVPSSSFAVVSPVRAVQQQERRQPFHSPNLRQRIKLRKLLNSATSML